jgi:hypothetical protein
MLLGRAPGSGVAQRSEAARDRAPKLERGGRADDGAGGPLSGWPEWSARAMTTATSRYREVVASPGAHRTGSERRNGFVSPSPRIEKLSPRSFALAQNMVHGMRGGVRELASRVKRKRLPHGHSLWVAARLLELAKCTAA